ncbi:MAG: Mut7-C ubiquitin/RNAse domain-containing protein [Chloroflexi bacterium]|nr:Mut7-C ubiquitin/RNAse domain-containing protein [Chloroflexota bacterium]
MKQAVVTFHPELVEILPRRRRSARQICPFEGRPSAKHMIESLGVPHTEIGAVKANGREVDLGYLVQDGDEIEVLPARAVEAGLLPEKAKVGKDNALRFVADTHLGKLATYLRMLGFDTLYEAAAGDEELAHISSQTDRVLLTRDRGLLKRKAITRGFCIVQSDPQEQIATVLKHFALSVAAQPFQRCLRCNSLLETVDKADVLAELPQDTQKYYHEFRRCPGCGQVYWQGSHYQRMQKFVARLLESPR